MTQFLEKSNLVAGVLLGFIRFRGLKVQLELQLKSLLTDFDSSVQLFGHSMQIHRFRLFKNSTVIKYFLLSGTRNQN